MIDVRGGLKPFLKEQLPKRLGDMLSSLGSLIYVARKGEHQGVLAGESTDHIYGIFEEFYARLDEAFGPKEPMKDVLH